MPRTALERYRARCNVGRTPSFVKRNPYSLTLAFGAGIGLASLLFAVLLHDGRFLLVYVFFLTFGWAGLSLAVLAFWRDEKKWLATLACAFFTLAYFAKNFLIVSGSGGVMSARHPPARQLPDSPAWTFVEVLNESGQELEAILLKMGESKFFFTDIAEGDTQRAALQPISLDKELPYSLNGTLADGTEIRSSGSSIKPNSKYLSKVVFTVKPTGNTDMELNFHDP